jgi:hypothetical protein
MARPKADRSTERGERRAETNASPNTLTALGAPKVPARSRANLEKRRAQIEQWIAEESSPIREVELIQHRLDIDDQLAQIDQAARLSPVCDALAGVDEATKTALAAVDEATKSGDVLAIREGFEDLFAAARESGNAALTSLVDDLRAADGDAEFALTHLADYCDQLQNDSGTSYELVFVYGHVPADRRGPRPPAATSHPARGRRPDRSHSARPQGGWQGRRRRRAHRRVRPRGR